MKDDMNDEIHNGTLKTLIHFDGMLNQDGMSKLDGKLKGDHATHFKGWIKKPIA